ncbi:MAG: Do family serine endopeptidase [Proteobacteria bacterium]|nr:Do family serine endopeptidase [Pseudomonadota bacterium]
MTEHNSPHSPTRQILSARRMVLLASAAGLAITVLAAGPATYRQLAPSSWFTAAQAAESPQPNAGFADLVAKVKPAVVSVRVKISKPAKTASTDEGDSIPPFEPGSPLEKFFRQFGGERQNAMPHRRQIITGEGSGFFISADGYAVTNYHVVDHAKSVHVTTDAGKRYTAKVVGTDEKTDLALIKIDGHTDFPFVAFSDHAPRVGDWVVAVGNPFGLGGTVTAGIVSARGRDIGSGPYNDFIQIDAPINKGNSGGPAFDLNGRVIGVNTAIYSPSGGSVGIGFDIPADTAKYVIAQLKEKGAVTRGWIGVQIQSVTADIADSLGMKKAEGAIVDEPQADSPAAKAGIRSGDVIASVDGMTVKDSRDLAKRIGALAPGAKAKLGVLRGGEEKTLTLTLGELPKEHYARAETTDNSAQGDGVPRLGLLLATAGNAAGAGGKGVVITAVDPDGPAAERGLRTGDVILDVGGKAVANPADVRKELAVLRKEGKHAVLMRLKSGEQTKFVALPLGNA